MLKESMEKYNKMQYEELDNKENNSSVNTTTNRSHYVEVLSKQSQPSKPTISASLQPCLTQSLAADGMDSFRKAALSLLSLDR
jgi:hypothetical protein